ncbi:MAG: GNAT family N-acetyltransferase [Candidatus Eremiobacteraeota bacterium]|nr:GNAT family N-acetyltransferase [Candidatus Eremiobacteraeota bacterium]MBV9736717.1 GNAT family N-acetyltransferase [Candidatus Eremiobacteraeota bacterium]
MELFTKRLRLRKLRVEDAPLLVSLYGDPEVQKTLPQPEPVTVERERAIIERQLNGPWTKEGSGMFAVFEEDGGDFVGCCGHLFWDIDGVHETEVAYAIMPQHWRKGYATEAALALKEDAFKRLGVKRVISLVMPGNVGSEKVAQNNGMHIEKQTVLLEKYHVNVWAVER